jgi:hypothetical protein
MCGYRCYMDRKAFGERMKLYVGITGIPAASAEDVMREARTPTYRSKGRGERVASRARWWWARLLVGVGLLCVAGLVRGPIEVTLLAGLLGALLVLSGVLEGYLHVRVFAKNQDSSQ